jgi:hypothetical protein
VCGGDKFNPHTHIYYEKRELLVRIMSYSKRLWKCNACEHIFKPISNNQTCPKCKSVKTASLTDAADIATTIMIAIAFIILLSILAILEINRMARMGI